MTMGGDNGRQLAVRNVVTTCLLRVVERLISFRAFHYYHCKLRGAENGALPAYKGMSGLVIALGDR